MTFYINKYESNDPIKYAFGLNQVHSIKVKAIFCFIYLQLPDFRAQLITKFSITTYFVMLKIISKCNKSKIDSYQ